MSAIPLGRAQSETARLSRTTTPKTETSALALWISDNGGRTDRGHCWLAHNCLVGSSSRTDKYCKWMLPQHSTMSGCDIRLAQTSHPRSTCSPSISVWESSFSRQKKHNLQQGRVLGTLSGSTSKPRASAANSEVHQPTQNAFFFCLPPNCQAAHQMILPAVAISTRGPPFSFRPFLYISVTSCRLLRVAFSKISLRHFVRSPYLYFVPIFQ